MAVALRAELHALEHFMTRGLRSITEWQERERHVTIASMTFLDIAEQTVFESLANKLGLLGAELTMAIAKPHAVIGQIRTNVEGLKNQDLQTIMSADGLNLYMADYETVEKTSREAIRALDKFIGDPERFPGLADLTAAPTQPDAAPAP